MLEGTQEMSDGMNEQMGLGYGVDFSMGDGSDPEGEMHSSSLRIRSRGFGRVIEVVL